MIHDNTQKNTKYDVVVIGAGIFGLYAALLFAKTGKRTLILEKEKKPFSKASFVNQARIHSGYHYPRSLSTALRTAHYVDRFVSEFDFAVSKELKQIYAISKNFSYTNATEYEKFCKNAGIRCEQIDTNKYFGDNMIEAAYLTDEYVFDANSMKSYLIDEIKKYDAVSLKYNSYINSAKKDGGSYVLWIQTTQGEQDSTTQTPYVFNATYANINNVLKLFGEEPLKIKYEFAEVALCSVSPELKDVGLTVMDGPFFSLMPFGFTGLHSLTAVSFTPNKTSTEPIDETKITPRTRFGEMKQLAQKYMLPEFDMDYKKSLFATKAILTKTELDDARPTHIQVHSESPRLVSVLSGKLNTIFDLDDTILI